MTIMTILNAVEFVAIESRRVMAAGRTHHRTSHCQNDQNNDLTSSFTTITNDLTNDHCEIIERCNRRK